MKVIIFTLEDNPLDAACLVTVYSDMEYSNTDQTFQPNRKFHVKHIGRNQRVSSVQIKDLY